MAVTCIHDFIVAVLAGRHELPHFHINEFLCKTFEDMLCLELCDSDVQDQVRTQGQTWDMLTVVWYTLTNIWYTLIGMCIWYTLANTCYTLKVM